MKQATYTLEIITPCFCAGADQSKAEIRASSIRGQLRWWFRVLGGFASSSKPVKEQEAEIFGSVAGEGKASKLVVRVREAKLTSSVKDGQELGHKNFSDPAYLTFPLQSREKQGQKTDYAGRGVVQSGKFSLSIQWRGDDALWPEIQALITVFGNLGSLGFRGRRAMGALAFERGGDILSPKPNNRGLEALPPLSSALQQFKEHKQLHIFKLDANNASDAISKLGAWLRSWRSYGRTGQNEKEQQSPGFRYAERDHDIGYNMQDTRNQPAYRPALGLPIIQRIRNGTNNWEQGSGKDKGRFASPVILRPHKDAQGNWHALVIFVDAHKWPDSKQVFLNGQPRAVSLGLYEAMQKDEILKPL